MNNGMSAMKEIVARHNETARQLKADAPIWERAELQTILEENETKNEVRLMRRNAMTTRERKEADLAEQNRQQWLRDNPFPGRVTKRFSELKSKQ